MIQRVSKTTREMWCLYPLYSGPCVYWLATRGVGGPGSRSELSNFPPSAQAEQLFRNVSWLSTATLKHHITAMAWRWGFQAYFVMTWLDTWSEWSCITEWSDGPWWCYFVSVVTRGVLILTYEPLLGSGLQDLLQFTEHAVIQDRRRNPQCAQLASVLHLISWYLSVYSCHPALIHLPPK